MLFTYFHFATMPISSSFHIYYICMFARQTTAHDSSNTAAFADIFYQNIAGLPLEPTSVFIPLGKYIITLDDREMKRETKL